MSEATEVADQEVVLIQGRDDVEEAIRTIGDLRRSLQKLQANMQQDVNEARQPYEKIIDEKERELEEWEEAVEKYCQDNRDELTGGGSTKTVKLATGKVQWRKGRDRVKVTGDEEDIIQKIKALGYDHLLSVKVKIDKREAKKYRGQIQEIDGLEIVSSESFKIKPNDE